MLSFLSPLFLAGAAAAAVPIVLHLLKREPEARVKFAAVKLLKHAPVEDTEKHRLRELLLLALRVATLVLLALAFARPFFASGAAAARGNALVIALDTSYSMSGAARFERARQLAKDAIARAPSGDLVGVLTFDDQADVVARPSSDRVLAASAVDQAQPTFGATRYRAAISAAVQSLAGRRGRIVLVTDLGENGWDAGDRAAVPEGVDVDIVDVGPPPPNVTVTALRALGDRVVASVHNASPQARDIRAHLTIDGRDAGTATAPLGPNQSGDVTFPRAARGTALAVSVDDPGGIAADDVRYAVVSTSGRERVLVVGGSGTLARDAFYVQHALAPSESGGRGYDVVPTSGAQLSSEDKSLADYAAIFLVSTRGLERRGREALAAYMRTGGGLFLASGQDVDGDIAADILGAGTSPRMTPVAQSGPRALAPTDGRHPLFRLFTSGASTLTLARFQNGVRLDGGRCQPLARFTSGETALVECAVGDGRALVFASDLDNRWNDFPLHASFVPFLHETVKYLASGRVRASEYLIADAPPGVEHKPGVHTIAASTPVESARSVAINVDAREGDSGRLTVDDFRSAVTKLKDTARGERPVEARQQEDEQHLWRYALALTVLTLALEGFVASRTV